MKNKINTCSLNIIDYLKTIENIETINVKQLNIQTIEHISTANKESLCVIYRHKELKYLQEKKVIPGFLLIDSKLKKNNFKNFKTVIACQDPQLCLYHIINFFTKNSKKSVFISKHAQIHPSAKIGCNVHIDDFVSIKENVVIEDNCTISSFCHLEKNSKIGKKTQLNTHVFVGEACQIGNNVTLKEGCKIGTEGFGIIRQKDHKLLEITHLANVVIEDHVLIGANTCIDRGKLRHTRIGEGSKIDNLCQIAHNVEIGKNCIICACSGIAGSSVLENNVTLAARVGVVSHIHICENVTIAANAVVRQSINKQGVYGGDPCINLKDHLKNTIIQKNLFQKKR